MNFNVTPDFLTIDGLTVPILVCDRETVLYYFDLVENLKHTDPEHFPNAYKELRNRVLRLRMAMYYRCEVSGELRLLSSLCLFEDKIVFTRVKRSILRERKQQERIKEREMKKQQKILQKEEAKEQRKQQAKSQALAKRGKTRLEIAMMNGRVTEEEFNAVDKTITPEDYQKEFDLLQKSGLLSMIEKERLPKVMTHDIILERIYQLKADRATAEFMRGLRS